MSRFWVLLLVACGGGSRPTAAPRPACPKLPPYVDPIELTTADGREAKVEHGEGFVKENGAWRSLGFVYSPDYFERAYSVDESCGVFRRADDGQLHPVKRVHADDFDSASDFVSLFGPARGWTAMTLQSPATPTVKDYVALRGCLLAKTCDFRDARFELQSEAGRGQFLRATSVPKSAAQQTSKASIESTLGFFVKGDDVTFRVRVRVTQGVPYSLFDLESTFMETGPGPRVVFFGGTNEPSRNEPLNLGIELKFLDKPVWRQSEMTRVPFPLGQWVLVEGHYRLEDSDEGVIELWQDGVKIIDARGRTLPIADTVLDSMEFAVTSNNDTMNSVVMDIDDVSVGVSE